MSTHLSFDDRKFIETNLSEGLSISFIAKQLNYSYSTISNEIKKHSIIQPASMFIHNKCALQFSCVKQKFFCKGCSRAILCKACPQDCNKFCKDFTEDCPRLKKAPHVCNGCPYKTGCRLTHKIYSANSAHNEYRTKLSDCRSGIALNKPEFYDLDNIITHGLANGQHLYHIFTSNNLKVSISTIYNYFNKGYLSAKNIDLPRKVKFKKRKEKPSDKVDYKKKQAILVGRRYDDYIDYCKNNTHKVIQLDTVVGIKGGKGIMTLHFCESNAMVGYLIPNISSYSVSNVFYHIKTEFERKNLKYGEIFDVVLTDNGKEFTNPKCIENDSVGNQVVKLFFCHPSSPYEKGKIEKNHVHIRDILPKGTNFNELTQKDLDLMFSHINSIKRKSLKGKSPYEVLVEKYGKEIPEIFGLKKIKSEEVIQNKNLIKKFTHE